MSDHFSAADRGILQAHGLDSFDALWALQLDAVDAPNTGRGGWSSVFRLDLGEAAYYLKRQSNYLTHTLRRPFGEPTFACEFRNIRRYQRLGIPALQAAFFGERRVDGERRAILLTRALDDWRDLHSWLSGWGELEAATRDQLLRACARLARTLHQAGQRHGCFYPKHIFLRRDGERFEACLIDLEKTRPLLFGRADRIVDLEALTRRAGGWSEDETRQLIEAYLDRDASDSNIDSWLEKMAGRRQSKVARA
ncbi:lipopolysaccharide kinase [Stutzerimonas stutzeri]|uniref:lipopolysaccharide kinase InaA family protein n=1 Tax=Stutzerimonas stutzeri TaxID=316 RepID=UPI0002E90A81|nr:lipopolysaccharide kinase InaA family protein [Stutzerimonas stutzeri]HAN53032.1 lipopolysaccharide kinase [Pseudomonas sp.]MDH0424652.1 lipopolysaccharide kinase InaA family protein [Stutzerimonas stutzeri]RRV40493.1 lipopolysaccharide kinase [Stutzerimonas stutzeri]RRW29260.1 lipopolysaccharide kinase [Stutzerimonas stutzeri]RSH67060.1 lipopolysaccharide kinase [Stutzerimonas stutzeri]